MSETQQAPAEEKADKKEKVKIKLNRDASVGGQIRKAGTVVMTTETEAKKLCNREFDGYHPCYGYLPEIGPLMDDGTPGSAEAPNPLARKKITRATRVS